MLTAILLSAVTIPPSSSAWTAQKPAVRQAVLAHHPRAVIDSILIKDGYALVHGTGFHEVLRRSGKTWNVVCDLSNSVPSANVLETRCNVPGDAATMLAMEDPVNIMAGQGNFSAAVAVEQSLAMSESSPQSPTERARFQQLRILNTQMQLQQITREQAIQQWNQLQYSWSLP